MPCRCTGYVELCSYWVDWYSAVAEQESPTVVDRLAASDLTITTSKGKSMNFTRHFKQFFGFLVLAFSLSGLLTATGAHAAQCKGLSKSKCESAADCSWVKSYTTSKGAKVDAYCRAKPSKDSKKSSGAEKTSTKKKDTEKSKTDKKSDEKKAETKKSTSKSEKTDKKKSSSSSEKKDKKTDGK